MDLYLVRHAIAEERDSSRWPGDRERPLTREGAKRFERVARRIRRLVPEVDDLLSSPLTRAWQTAEILHREAGWPAPAAFPDLEPGADPREAIRSLKAYASSGAVALVGHEPDLSDLAARLLAGEGAAGLMAMKKGGVLRLRIEPSLRAGSAEMVWLLTPKTILDLAG